MAGNYSHNGPHRTPLFVASAEGQVSYVCTRRMHDTCAAGPLSLIATLPLGQRGGHGRLCLLVRCNNPLVGQ
jgi:hypothetical protein